MARIDRKTLTVGLLLALSGCASDEGTAPDEDLADADDDPQPDDGGSEVPLAQVACADDANAVAVTLTTEDGLVLEADLHATGEPGGPAVVLLHMIPPSNDKSNYPLDFIQALHGAGFTVLNVNRRGAGRSEGEPGDAYQGPLGQLDAAAAHRFVTETACEAAANDVAFIGASNGTTTALDFAIQSPEGSRPAALAFLSPGGYTENQHTVADEIERLADVPLFVGYPDSEAAWPGGIAPLDTGNWEFREYPGGRHGAGLFDSDPDVAEHLLDFLVRTQSG